MFIIVLTILTISWLVKTYDNSNGKVGEIRVINRFLLTPTVINCESRFLTKAKILQEYYKTPCGEYRWINKEWMT